MVSHPVIISQGLSLTGNSITTGRKLGVMIVCLCNRRIVVGLAVPFAAFLAGSI
jgi:hypothetical protein